MLIVNCSTFYGLDSDSGQPVFDCCIDANGVGTSSNFLH